MAQTAEMHVNNKIGVRGSGWSKSKNHKASAKPIKFWPFFLCFTLIAVGVLFNASQKALLAQGSFDVKRLKTEREARRLEHESLLAKEAVLLSTQRIEKVAVSKLRMSTPPKVSYIKVEPPASKNRESLAMAKEERQGFLTSIWQKLEVLR